MGTSPRVDLNADLGELPGDAGAAVDDAMLQVVTSANVACGGHAGDAESMRRVTRVAAASGVAIGAHVSYPDREGFGRRPFAGALAHLLDILHEQVAVLQAAAGHEGTRVSYIKAHGILYNASVAGNPEAVECLVSLAASVQLPLLTMSGGALAKSADARAVPWYAEAFADRGYLAGGHLVPRGHPQALVTDEDAVARRVHTMVRHGRVETVDGPHIGLQAHSVCVHSDTPGAHRLARAVRDFVEADGIIVAAFTAGADR